MHRGLSGKYLGFVVATIGLVLFLLIRSTTQAPRPTGSKELYAFYGLQHPDTLKNQEPATQEEPIVNPGLVDQPQEATDPEPIIGPQLPATFPDPPKPTSPPPILPIDALGEISDILTESQCTEAFPELYQAIDRSVRHWFLGRQKISPEDVDIAWRSDPSLQIPGGAIRFMVHNNELRILETRGAIGAGTMGYHDRAEGVLHLIQRALDSATAGGELLPTIEVRLHVPSYLGMSR